MSTPNPLDELIADDVDVIERVLMAAPSAVTDSMLDGMIHKLRNDRALFIKKELNKGDPNDPPPNEEAETDQASDE